MKMKTKRIQQYFASRFSRKAIHQDYHYHSQKGLDCTLPTDNQEGQTDSEDIPVSFFSSPPDLCIHNDYCHVKRIRGKEKCYKKDSIDCRTFKFYDKYKEKILR